MPTSSQVDRRATPDAADSGHPSAQASHVVRQGMVIQASMGTRSAVEFLKRQGVHGAVIHRVLMGDQVRRSDRLRRNGQPGIDDRVAIVHDVAIDDPRR